jgi:tRNA modification GTPase
LISRLRQRTSLIRSIERLGEAASEFDPVLRAESLRLSARELDEITGRIGTEQVLDGIFGRFCIGK